LSRYRVLVEKKAFGQLGKIGKDARNRMIEALHILRGEGFSARLDIKKLRGYRKQYRLRVGKYRILFELRAEKTLVVYAILPRKAAY